MLLKVERRGPDRNFSYLVGPDAPAGAPVPLAAIDPGADPAPLLALSEGRPVGWIIVTHGHGDHTAGVVPMKRRVPGALVVGHPRLREYGVPVDRPVGDGDELDLAPGLVARVLHTPGHQAASICLLVGGKALFTGDTLFVGNCGRTDLHGGDPRALYESLKRLAALPDEVAVYAGHDYGRSPSSTIGREKAENPTLRARSFEEFDALP